VALVAIAMLAYGVRNLLRGRFETFTVDLLLCVLGTGLLPLAAWGLLHVSRYGRGWFVLDRRIGSFVEPGWLGPRREFALSDIERIEVLRMRSSEDSTRGLDQPGSIDYESRVDRVSLRLRGRKRAYLPWGSQGGPDKAVEVAREVADFLNLELRLAPRRFFRGGEGSLAPQGG